MKVNNVNKQIEYIKELKATLGSDTNLNMVLTFLELAKDRGITGRDLESLLDMPSATAARMLKRFDKVQSNGKEGYDMVEARLDPTDYRNKLRYLNQAGKAFLAQLDEILFGKQ